jgi:hypothetical protein
MRDARRVMRKLGLVWIVGCAAFGQTAPAPHGSGPAQTVQVQIVREIDDPPSGVRWLLERDPSRPGGPGRLVPAPEAHEGATTTLLKSAAALPVIRTGDRVIVEQSTPILDARLEAIALNPALTGSPLKARLIIGGRVVQALALGPGRAQLAPEGGRP